MDRLCSSSTHRIVFFAVIAGEPTYSSEPICLSLRKLAWRPEVGLRILRSGPSSDKCSTSQLQSDHDAHARQAGKTLQDNEAVRVVIQIKLHAEAFRKKNVRACL